MLKRLAGRLFNGPPVLKNVTPLGGLQRHRAGAQSAHHQMSASATGAKPQHQEHIGSMT